MTTAVEYNMLRKQNNLPLVRFDLRQLTELDLLDLRNAYEGMYAIDAQAPGDDRGYFSIARQHGYDRRRCHNIDAPFLPWHRGYIYVFEKQLTDGLRFMRNNPELLITLPWWDWTYTNPVTDAANGIPRSLNDPTYVDPVAGGAAKPNPLFRAKSLYRIVEGNAAGEAQYTVREPDLVAWLPQLRSMVATAMAQTQFPEFNNDRDVSVEQPHNVLHGSISGDMGGFLSSSYDPLFWLHHAFVDKLWFDWQRLDPAHDSTVPQSVLSKVVYGGFTGAQTLDSEGFLRVIYGSQPVSGVVPPDAVNTGTEEAPLPPTMRIPLGRLHSGAGPLRRVTLHLHHMTPPKKSCLIRVFINQPNASAVTPTAGNPAYAGVLALFGHGPCYGALGHCNPALAPRDAYDLRAHHHLEPHNYEIDLTRAANDFLAGIAESGAADLVLSFVVVDYQGQQIAPEEIDVESLSLTTE